MPLHYSPLFGQILVSPFDFRLTRSPTDTQDSVRVIFGSCTSQLQTQNHQEDGNQHGTHPRFGSASPLHHRWPLSSSNAGDRRSYPEATGLSGELAFLKSDTGNRQVYQKKSVAFTLHDYWVGSLHVRHRRHSINVL